MEREKFEESWKNAFEKAEISPSENVWTNIELDLEKARGGELKRRLLFYKMLAAACVVFAMAVGGVGYYHSLRPDTSGTLADNRVSSEADQTIPSDAPPKSDLSAAEGKIDSNGNVDRQNSKAENNTGIANSEGKFPQERLNTVRPSTENHIANRISPDDRQHRERSHVIESEAIVDALTSNDGDIHDEGSFIIEDKDVSPLYTLSELRLKIPRNETPEVDPVVAMLAKLEQREKEVQDEKGNKKKSELQDENLWTSIGFAAGSFNAIQSSSASPVATGPSAAYSNAMAAPIVDQETKANGYSYTMGVNVGTKISERWVLQGGVNYLTHSSEYTANNVVMEPMGKFNQQRFRAISTNDLVDADEAELSNKLVYSAPYNVNNSMRYLSIPMQAGYLLVNKTFGLQVNAGIATDLFLQNTVKAESDQLAKTSQPSGADSPYRAVNLSGLFGTEFSYRFGPHYRVSLNPGLRYPFNTIYKSELGVQSAPLTFDVGLRFRYIFH